MKKFLLTLCVIAAASSAVRAQAPKLGHINRQDLMLMLPERKEAETKMQAFAKSLDDRLKAMGEEYQTMVAKAQADAPTMTDTQKQAAMRDIQELEQRITQAQEKAKEDLAKQEEELLAPMVKRTNDAIKQVATEGKFTYIFDSSTGMVLFYDGGEDILPAVKKKLNITAAAPATAPATTPNGQ
ncbi:MAG TPA: OmpH family outer membrane protein [Flavobacteriales bacterium]|jgi:outer membrane protein|nr:OmpH family outer membrane protein [Flavobacteriales bacterium]